MSGAPYQYCSKCKEEKNFKWADGFTLECISCGHKERPSVKEPVKFAAMKIEGNNDHLSMEESEQLFGKIVEKYVPEVVKINDIPFDVKSGVVGELPRQGRDIKPTPLDIKVPDFPTSTNLRIFMKGTDDEG